MQLYKVRQRLGAVPPDPCVLDLQPVETPFKKSWVRPCNAIESPCQNESIKEVNNEPLLVVECISSEESAVQESDNESERESGNSEQEDEMQHSSWKRLIKHWVAWRSVGFHRKSLRVLIGK